MYVKMLTWLMFFSVWVEKKVVTVKTWYPTFYPLVPALRERHCPIPYLILMLHQRLHLHLKISA